MSTLSSWQSRRPVLGTIVLLLCAGCASEEERACVAARALVEAEYRQLLGAGAVGLLLVLAVGYLQRRQQLPRTTLRGLAAAVLFLPALGAAALFGAMTGELIGENSRDCGDQVVLFSASTDLLIAVVVIGGIGLVLLTLTATFTILSWSTWRG